VPKAGVAPRPADHDVDELSHRTLTTWALGHVRIEPRFAVLDVGCGGGATLARLADHASAGYVAGIDYSPASVATARRVNATRIRAGRVEIRLGAVSALPFDEAAFDLVTAFETHYYWPDLRGDFREVARVLRPGGTFVLGAETYRTSPMSWLYAPVMKALGARFMTPDEHRDALLAAGYRDVEVFRHPANGWLCAVGRKPSATDD
jgi:SAM-dependent methyltransferase